MLSANAAQVAGVEMGAPAPVAAAGAKAPESLAVAAAGAAGARKNRIQVSTTKKPLYFYVNLSKRFLQQFGEVELSGLGTAISTVVTAAEILKNSGLALEKRITTSTIDLRDDSRGGAMAYKAKLEVVMVRSANFHELMQLAAEEAAVAPPESGIYH